MAIDSGETSFGTVAFTASARPLLARPLPAALALMSFFGGAGREGLQIFRARAKEGFGYLVGADHHQAPSSRYVLQHRLGCTGAAVLEGRTPSKRDCQANSGDDQFFRMGPGPCPFSSSRGLGKL